MGFVVKLCDMTKVDAFTMGNRTRTDGSERFFAVSKASSWWDNLGAGNWSICHPLELQAAAQASALPLNHTAN